MKKSVLIEQTATADGKSISLVEHDGAYAIRVDGAELMSTRQHGSEDRLAELACAHLKNKPAARVLIGGLGMGFTLKAALACLAADATVVTAEILGAVIAWNRNPAYPLAGVAMEDPRVMVVEQDVMEAIRAAPGGFDSGFDSIILDVDNGPAALTTESNARLYDAAGLRLTYAALKPGGCAAFWSAARDAAFEKALARAGFAAATHICRSHGNAGRRHTVFTGKRGLGYGSVE